MNSKSKKRHIIMAQKLLTPINCHNFLPLVGSNWSSQTSYGSADSRTSEKHNAWGQDSNTFVIDLCTVTVVMVWISIEDSCSQLLELSWLAFWRGLVQTGPVSLASCAALEPPAPSIKTAQLGICHGKKIRSIRWNSSGVTLPFQTKTQAPSNFLNLSRDAYSLLRSPVMRAM